MFRILVIISVLASVFGATITRKGLIPLLDGRIVGGHDTTIEEFPHQISMRYFGRHRCGGSIFSERIIISAAHCVDSISPEYLTIVAGITRLSENRIAIKVKNIYSHENYNPSTVDNDISMLVLDELLPFGDTIKPIPLQEIGVEVKSGATAMVSGWGTLSESGHLSDVLQYVEVVVMGADECSAAYSSVNKITENMLCAGYIEGGRDACQGDSGGPLILQGKQIGVVSWGWGCARPSYPGVYSKVSHLHKWIKIKIANMA